MSKSQKKPSPIRRLLFRRVSLIGTAVLLLILFGVFHLLGWRDNTSIISGTSIGPGNYMSALRGVLYGLTYFLAVILSPILIITAGINAVLRRWVGRIL